MTRRSGLLAAWLSTFLAAASALSAEPLEFRNDLGGTVTLYGQFNPAILSVDDGVTTDTDIVDSAHSNSRAGLLLAQPLDQGLLGFNLEFGLGLPQSSAFSQTNQPTFDWTRANIRKVDFSFQTSTSGKFYLGQGSMASDGTADTDLSGTTLVLYSGIGDTAGSYRFRTTGGALSDVTISAATPNYDGGRLVRLRYDTPELGESGITVSVAAGEEFLDAASDDRVYDLGVFYSGQFGGARLAAALGLSRLDRPGAASQETLAGSISVLWDSGFNLGLAAGSREDAGAYVYGKIGYIGDWWRAGSTALAADFYQGEDTTRQGARTEVLGLGIVQSVDALNLEAYAGYRVYDYADPAARYQAISSVLAGARWRF